VLFDTWVHPLVMGLEEHLLAMFREDFEFHDAAGPSHHGGRAARLQQVATAAPAAAAEGGSMPPVAAPLPAPQADVAPVAAGRVVWLACAEKELGKVPFFVRGKARRNTESFATERGLHQITVETLYEAKAHYAR